MSSLTRSAIVGIASNSAGSAIIIVTQILSTSATARLISPREFGVYATAQALAGFAGYFTMNALGSGLQRRAHLGPDTVGTAVVLSLGSGFLVAAAVWTGAGPWASTWRVPEAAPLVRLIAVSLFLTCATTVPLGLLRRDLRFKAAAAIETGTQVTALAAAVALAFALHSATALVLGQAIGSAALVVCASVLVRGQLRLGFSCADARGLGVFAGQVGLLNLGFYVTSTTPSWYAARSFGPFVLGVYSRAAMIVGLPLTYAVTSMVKVLYPLYGHVRGDADRTRRLLDEGLVLSTGLVWPVFAMMAGAATVIVDVLLGSRWHAAAPFLALYALIACADLPCSLLTNAGEAFGWMRVIFARQSGLLVGVVLTVGIAHLAGAGMVWVVAGVAAVQWITYLATVVPFVRRGLLDGGAVARSHVANGAAALGAYGVVAASSFATSGFPVPVQAVVVTAVGLGVCGVLLTLRRWLPAGRVLERRLAQAFPAKPGVPQVRATVS